MQLDLFLDGKEALLVPSAPMRYWIGCARWNVGDKRQARRLWLPLCWLAPESFARQAPTVPSRTPREGWATFDSEADAAENGDVRAGRIAWFPAWLALQGVVRGEPSPAVSRSNTTRSTV
jgi:hypothetical protein